jgi:DNA-binding transcriptional LysR family regulator
MDQAQLNAFVDVARSGSFAGVARTLGTDPSNVSRSIAQLEAELGFRLFQRTTRSLSLTEAGHAYLARIAPLVDELQTAREEALALTAKPQGQLRVTSSVAFGNRVVAPLISSFRAQYPNVTLDLLMTDAVVDLVAERVDLAIRLAPRIDTGFIGMQLMRTHYRVVASPAYLKRHKGLARAAAKPRDLSEHACCVFPLAGFRSRWHFRPKNATDAAEAFNVHVQAALIASSGSTLLQCALDGVGPSLLANWLVDEHIAKGELVHLFADHDVTATDFETAAWVLYPSRAYLPLKTRVFIDHLKNSINPANAK